MNSQSSNGMLHDVNNYLLGLNSGGGIGLDLNSLKAL